MLLFYNPQQFLSPYKQCKAILTCAIWLEIKYHPEYVSCISLVAVGDSEREQ